MMLCTFMCDESDRSAILNFQFGYSAQASVDTFSQKMCALSHSGPSLNVSGIILMNILLGRFWEKGWAPYYGADDMLLPLPESTVSNSVKSTENMYEGGVEEHVTVD